MAAENSTVPSANERSSEEREKLLAGGVQLLDDPLTESSRKKQSLVLLLSLLSMSISFGIFLPDKATVGSLAGDLAKPKTTNEVICIVLAYALVTFWLSVYRDSKVARYRKESPIRRLAAISTQEIELFEEKVRLASVAVNDLTVKGLDNMNDYLEKIEPIRKLQRDSLDLSPDWEKHAERSALFDAREKALDDLDAIFNEKKAVIDRLRDEALVELSRLVETQKTSGMPNAIVIHKMFSSFDAWKKAWTFLEIVFPSVLGLVAIGFFVSH